jgi:hypothetical protein
MENKNPIGEGVIRFQRIAREMMDRLEEIHSGIDKMLISEIEQLDKDKKFALGNGKLIVTQNPEIRKYFIESTQRRIDTVKRLVKVVPSVFSTIRDVSEGYKAIVSQSETRGNETSVDDVEKEELKMQKGIDKFNNIIKDYEENMKYFFKEKGENSMTGYDIKNWDEKTEKKWKMEWGSKEKYNSIGQKQINKAEITKLAKKVRELKESDIDKLWFKNGWVETPHGENKALPNWRIKKIKEYQGVTELAIYDLLADDPSHYIEVKNNFIKNLGA